MHNYLIFHVYLPNEDFPNVSTNIITILCLQNETHNFCFKISYDKNFKPLFYILPNKYVFQISNNILIVFLPNKFLTSLDHYLRQTKYLFKSFRISSKSREYVWIMKTSLTQILFSFFIHIFSISLPMAWKAIISKALVRHWKTKPGASLQSSC